MAKRKIIWSRTAKKKLYSFFESDIRRGIDKSSVKGKFNNLFKQVKLLKKQPDHGVATSDKTVFALVTDFLIVYYELSAGEVIIHTLESKASVDI